MDITSRPSKSEQPVITPIGGQVSHHAESIIVLKDLRDLYTIIVVCVSVIRGSWGQDIKTWESLLCALGLPTHTYIGKRSSIIGIVNGKVLCKN